LVECPFCANEVDEDLITFGGPCPKCFADIPGEEAATDPGEEVKAAEARKDQLRMTMRTVLPFVLAMPVVFCLGVGALWYGFLRPAPVVVMLDFDELDEYPIELVAVSPEEAAEDGDLKSAGTRRVVRSGEDAASAYAPGTGELGIGDAKVDLGGDAVADGGEGTRGTRSGIDGPSSGPALGGGVSRTSKQEAGLDFGLDVSTARRGAMLEDPEAIRKMIGQRLRDQAPRLNSCYESQLKTNETLSGRWRIAFTVTSEGKAISPSAEGLNASVGPFEDCLVREVGKWSFQRIKHDQPVRKTFTFRPAS